MWGSQFMDNGDWLWMSVMMALVWLPIILVLVWLLRGTPPDQARRSEPDHEDAREIARRAYARGELTREQFNQILADLATPPATHRSGVLGDRAR